MELEAMTGLGGAGAPHQLMAALQARGIGTESGGGFGARGAARPDPHQPLADRGVSVDGLSNVADVLGTTTDELVADLGDDASFADLVERAKAADVDPRDFLQAVAADVGGGPVGGGSFGGGPFGGSGPSGGGLPPLVFDSAAADASADVVSDWLASLDDGDDQ